MVLVDNKSLQWTCNAAGRRSELCQPEKGKKFLLKEAVETAGDVLLGADVMKREGGWNLLCKFFDNMGPIPHHMHQTDEFAKLVGQKGKPEAYYFPPQYNQIQNNFPHTYMGLEPGTTKDDIRRCLERWNQGDNGILAYARAYRLVPGEGWQINPGILHAPGSLVTYEPQVNSDVFAMFQSEVEGRIVDWELLTKDVKPEFSKDIDYLISMLDWDANINPEFAKTNKTFPRAVKPEEEMKDQGYREVWVTYGTPYLLGEGADGSAKPDCHDQRQCGVWCDSLPRDTDAYGQSDGFYAFDDSLWTDD